MYVNDERTNYIYVRELGVLPQALLTLLLAVYLCRGWIHIYAGFAYLIGAVVVLDNVYFFKILLLVDTVYIFNRSSSMNTRLRKKRGECYTKGGFPLSLES